MVISLIAVVAVSLVLGLPDHALAWGPVTHLVHGSLVLERLQTLPAVTQDLLLRFPYEYLYGCIGADIIQAKKFTRSFYTHCHHWRTGWDVLARGRGPMPSARSRTGISRTSRATPSRTITFCRCG